MSSENTKDLFKIGLVTLLGLASLCVFIFWLKKADFTKKRELIFYFKNVNGLEEGASLRWHGLKIGLVSEVIPVQKDFQIAKLPANEILALGKKHLSEAKESLLKSQIEDLVFIREKINTAQQEIAVAKLARTQHMIKKGTHIKVIATVTTSDVPISPLNQVAIVPSGLIGEQYIDITSIEIDRECDYSNGGVPIFVTVEPIRLDSLIKTNIESSEAIKNLANRVNATFTPKDADNIKKLIKSANEVVSDSKTKKNIEEAAANINEITKDFKIWKILF